MNKESREHLEKQIEQMIKSKEFFKMENDKNNEALKGTKRAQKADKLYKKHIAKI